MEWTGKRTDSTSFKGFLCDFSLVSLSLKCATDEGNGKEKRIMRGRGATSVINDNRIYEASGVPLVWNLTESQYSKNCITS